MWSPADKSALPTLEELKMAKETINLVRRDLETAMEALAQAQLRIEILNKNLEERIAWIAPVRKLPFDVLSMVFDWCGDIKWDSPARIAAVCRTWREVVLDTPRAWSFVSLNSKMKNEGISIFLERSRERPLHLYLPQSRFFDISSVAHRIHCLSLDDIRSPPQTIVFPNLQRLRISPRASAIPIAEVTAHRFPALRHLVTVSAPLFLTTVEENIFLPLERWSIRTSESRAWLDGLRSWQNTLVSLTLFCPTSGVPGEQPLIQLPVLRYMKILAPGVLRRGAFDLKTPMLEAYEHRTGILRVPEGPIHTDVSTVSEMRLSILGELSLSLLYCLGMKRLQIDKGYSGTVTSVLDQLSADEQICPVLRNIELLADDLDIGPYSERLPEINSRRSLPIEITTASKWTDLPGCMISCGYAMPCTGDD